MLIHGAESEVQGREPTAGGNPSDLRFNQRVAVRARAPLACLVAIVLAGAAASAHATPRLGCAVPSGSALARLPTHGVVVGDMNGDGRADRVSLAVDRQVRLPCRYVLVADLGATVLTTFVRQPDLNEQTGMPQLVELARVNRGKDAQAIVNFGVGAYVDEHGLYDIDGSRIVRMKVLPAPQKPEFDNTFGQGASNAGGIVSFCADGPASGTVLVVGTESILATGKSRPSPYGDLYVQYGESYRLVPGRHRLTPKERRNLLVGSPHGIRAEIFLNCAIASTR